MMKYNVVVKITNQELREMINDGKEIKVFPDVELDDIERHLMIIEKCNYIELVRIIPSQEGVMLNA